MTRITRITRRNLSYYAFALAVALSATVTSFISAEEVEKDVPYVPTPQAVVDKMLELAAPKKGEVLYDLGCGDGRIVVTAAKKYDVKGTGVDIDPQRIKESNENAETNKVADKVKFVKGNLFEMDLSDANVVTLYLLPSVNERLRPQLLKQLKPGSRVVSHAFDMGDWEADEEVQVPPDNQTVYFWVIPANVDGTWKLTLPDGKPATVELQQTYQKVTGTATVADKKQEITDAALKGADLTFTVNGAKYAAKIDGDKVKGTVTANGGKAQEFTGKREKAKPKGTAALKERQEQGLR